MALQSLDIVAALGDHDPVAAACAGRPPAKSPS